MRTRAQAVRIHMHAHLPAHMCLHAGKDVYVDLQGWHVYLKDLSAAPNVKMHALLASQIGPQVMTQHFGGMQIPAATVCITPALKQDPQPRIGLDVCGCMRLVHLHTAACAQCQGRQDANSAW